MQRYFVYAFCACVIFALGCRPPQYVKDAWKSTQSYYKTYLNTPATLDMGDTGGLEEYQAELGAAIAGFDASLSELERVMANSDRSPDPSWVGRMSSRFPWISGIALTDEFGYAHANINREYPKPFDVGTMLETDPKQLLKDLRAYAQFSDLGPELYLGNPMYRGEEFRGLIVVHFDPRALLARTADPARFMIASSEGIIWPGLYDADSTPVAAINWGEVVLDSSHGTVSNANGTFYWVARYFGNLPLVYAVKVSGEFPERLENMAGLSEATSRVLGAVNIGHQSSPQRYEPQDLGNIGAPNVAPNAPILGAPAPAAPRPAGAPLPY